MNDTVLEVPADQPLDVRVACQQRSVTKIHRDRRAISKRHGFEEFFETGRRNGPGDDPDKLALLPNYLDSGDRRPASVETAVHEFHQDGRGRISRFESLEEGPVADGDSGSRPRV